MAERLMNSKQHTFTWNISNFSFLPQKKGEFIKSPVFKAVSIDETTWYLKLYPRGDEDSKIDEIACFLTRSDTGGPFKIECGFKIEIFATNGKSLARSEISEKFEKGDGSGWDDFSKKDLLIGNFSSFKDTLTIKCYLSCNVRKPVLLSESIGLTKVDVEQCTFKWVVKNVNSACLETVKFPYAGLSQVEITIQAPDNDIKISVRRLGSIKPQNVICRMTLLDLEGKEHDSKQDTFLFEAEDMESDIWEFPTFLEKSKVNSEKEKYIKDDSFTLKCEISVTNGTVISKIENKVETGSETVHVIPHINNFATLKADLKRMYTDKTQTDVELILDKKVFPAHKFILSARSPVFLAMFKQDMMENQSGQVNISDLEVKILDSLLEFMYTGAVNEMSFETAMKLFLAADKYQVFTLKDECSGYLRAILTDSNVCEILEVSELVGDKSLRGASARYIKDHSKEVLVSDEWKLFAKNNLTLATEIFCEVSKLLAEDSK